jgi:hypothetical protein
VIFGLPSLHCGLWFVVCGLWCVGAAGVVGWNKGWNDVDVVGLGKARRDGLGWGLRAGAE